MHNWITAPCSSWCLFVEGRIQPFTGMSIIYQRLYIPEHARYLKTYNISSWLNSKPSPGGVILTESLSWYPRRLEELHHGRVLLYKYRLYKYRLYSESFKLRLAIWGNKDWVLISQRVSTRLLFLQCRRDDLLYPYTHENFNMKTPLKFSWVNDENLTRLASSLTFTSYSRTVAKAKRVLQPLTPQTIACWFSLEVIRNKLR